MKKTVKIVSAIMVLIIIITSLSSCFLFGEQTWENRYKNLVVYKTKEVENILVSYYTPYSSDISDRKLDEDNIKPFLDIFDKKMTFAECEAPPIISSFFIVTFINDMTVTRDSDEKVISDDSGAYYKYALRVHVDADGYVLIGNLFNVNSKWYKSDITVNVDSIREYHKESPQYTELFK